MTRIHQRKAPVRLSTAAPLILTLAGCSVAPPIPLRLDDARVAVATRWDSLGVDAALDGLELPESAWALPAAAQRAEPSQPGFWLVRALAWSPEVRAARREWRAAVASAKSAGAPAPVAVQAVDHELGGDDELFEAIAVFDLIGLLGLGPSGAERERATAEAQLALGRIERAAFDAWVRVEGARLRTVAARARAERLRALGAEAAQDLARVEILERHGRLSDSMASVARAELDALERLVSLASEDLVAARAGLARAAGVPLATGQSDAGRQTTAWEAVGSSIDRLRPVDPGDLRPGSWFTDNDRADSHPRLREARLVFALREAEVREMAAAAWPTLGLGPHVGVLDGAQVGAVLRFMVPFPSSWRGRLEAAVERRDRAVEAFEETLYELELSEADGLARLTEIAARGDGISGRAMSAAEGHWRAARARFRTGRGDIAEWLQSLRHVQTTVTWTIDDAESAALAALDVAAARGPLASPFAASGLSTEDAR